MFVSYCSEATIAKRRSYANTISYLTPPAENAGLYKGLKVGSRAVCDRSRGFIEASRYLIS